jgi:hypothetical protein
MKKQDLNEIMWRGNNFILYRGYIMYRKDTNSEYKKYSYKDIHSNLSDSYPQFEICEWLFNFKGIATAVVGFIIINMAMPGLGTVLYLLAIGLTIYLGFRFRRHYISLLFKDRVSFTEFLFSGDKEKLKNKLNLIQETIRNGRLKKGTILDLIKLDLDNLIRSPEDSNQVELEEGKIKFIEYSYNLDEKEIGVFNKLVIRLFSEQRYFSKDVISHIWLLAPPLTDSTTKIMAAEDIISFFGKDDMGKEKLTDHEIQELHYNRDWSGRSWTFNKSLSLLNSPKETYEDKSYLLWFSQDEQGLKLQIVDYHDLIRDLQ